MKLYYHETDGGAEYYSTICIDCADGSKEGTFEGVVMRTDGNEIEIFTEQLKRMGIRLVIN